MDEGYVHVFEFVFGVAFLGLNIEEMALIGKEVERFLG
jgi:hypothetical protein